MQTGFPGLALEKRCSRCRVVKALAEFASRGGSRFRPATYCRPCQREYSKAHYQKNRVMHNRRRYVHQVEYRARNRACIGEYIRSRSCIDCGESDPVVLEFDHVRGAKRYDISRMTRCGFSWKRILEELAKCE